MSDALAFASPQLVAAARECAGLLALVPRVAQPANAPRPRNKGCWKQRNPRPRKAKPTASMTAREERLAGAARYFLPRHPAYTRAQRVRFGQAHGFGRAEFARAIRAARATLRETCQESSGFVLGTAADAGARAKSLDLPANRVATARDEHALTQPTNRRTGSDLRQTARIVGGRARRAPVIFPANQNEKLHSLL